jgi:hypothetical protein
LDIRRRNKIPEIDKIIEEFYGNGKQETT